MQNPLNTAETQDIAASASGTSRPSFWRRRVLDPVIGQLKQGVTPPKMAESIAWGAVIGIFPILGTTTALCGIFAVFRKLNHVATQTINWLTYPLQILLIIPFLQAGNLIFGRPSFSMSLNEIIGAFETDFAGAIGELGWTAARGVVAWVIFALPTVLLVKVILTPPLTRLATAVQMRRAAS